MDWVVTRVCMQALNVTRVILRTRKGRRTFLIINYWLLIYNTKIDVLFDFEGFVAIGRLQGLRD
jgi:hypothetical protein